MDKYDPTVDEIRGLLKLIRGDIGHYFQQIGWLLMAILAALVIIIFK